MKAHGLLLAALLFLGFAAPTARADDAIPHLLGYAEGQRGDTGENLIVVYGRNLDKVVSYELRTTGMVLIATLQVQLKSKDIALLILPGGQLPGDYILNWTFGGQGLKSSNDQIHLSLGSIPPGSVTAASLDAALAADLADAATVGGQTAAQLHDAALLTGTLGTSSFSAYDDLVAESKIGTGAAQVAAGSHNHDSSYYTETELNASGGTLNSGANPVDWSRLKGVPASFADGTDDGAAYLAGSGLTLTGATFAADFAGPGSATTVARSDHDHDAFYYTESELNATGGTLNNAGNPMDWSRLKSVPAGFADGTDDGTTYSAGSGLTLTGTVFAADFGGNGSATTLSRSDHNHDASYYTESELNATGGTLNSGTNPVDWSRLKSVPAGFSDGTDDSVALAGSGSATTASKSDHTHTGTYLRAAGGDTLTGTITLSTSGSALSGTSGNTNFGGTGGLDCTASGGTGIAGHGNVGVFGDLDSDGSYALWARTQYGYQTGLYIQSYGQGGNAINVYKTGNYGYGVVVNHQGKYGTGLRVTTSQNYTTAGRFRGGYQGTGIFAYAYRGKAVNAYAYGYNSIAFHAYCYGGRTGLMVRGGYSSTMAVFKRYGNNVARIDGYGRGYFNGGTYNSGADFAESVKVDEPVREFEPGDVMVIDPKAPRQFSLSREANSTLVAGVISTKPALVGTQHDMAGKGRAALKDEVRLGIVGICPTKVCDENGAIRIGDLLVASSVPGHAMKAPANPAVGTVIGKALGALEAGTGKVEVLLMAR